MDSLQILDKLAEGKSVKEKEYDYLIQTQQYKTIINALKKRFEISSNPKTILEIFRLCIRIGLFDDILSYKESVENAKEDMVLDDYLLATKQIEFAQTKKVKEQQEQSLPHKQNKKNESDTIICVHHDNEPYVDRKIVIPEDKKEFEKLLNQASYENPDYYEFLLRYKYPRE